MQRLQILEDLKVYGLCFQVEETEVGYFLDVDDDVHHTTRTLSSLISS